MTGPSFSAIATQSQTYGDLKSGSYTVVGRDVRAGGITYRAAPANQTVQLPPGISPVGVSVVYAAVSAGQ